MYNNFFEANPEKCYFLANDSGETAINIGLEKILSNSSQKLLRIHITAKLSFEHHIEIRCCQTSQKLNALSRVAHYMNLSQRKIIMKAFIFSQFGYCPLVWTFHSRR